MSFKKLLLATAISAVSSASFAMESMDDESMSETTGQDGLTITITPPGPGISADLVVHDMDGYSATGAGTVTDAGAILIDNFRFDPTNSIVVKIDADGDASNGGAVTDAFLNINVALTGNTTISTGAISVASSNGAGVALEANSTSAVLFNSMDIVLGDVTLNMQLGNEPQGSMLLMSTTTITTGIKIVNFAMNDTSAGGGSINVGTMKITDFGFAANNLQVALKADVTAATGLDITLTQVGAGTTGFDITMESVGLGTSGTVSDIGDIDILGLNLNGTTISIKGH